LQYQPAADHQEARDRTAEDAENRREERKRRVGSCRRGLRSLFLFFSALLCVVCGFKSWRVFQPAADHQEAGREIEPRRTRRTAEKKEKGGGGLAHLSAWKGVTDRR
jgi:hypothetical protein